MLSGTPPPAAQGGRFGAGKEVGVSVERGVRKTRASGWSLFGGLEAKEGLVEIAMDPSRTACTGTTRLL